VRIDLYGSSGDYLASGIDGLEIRVHGNAQDQLCQVMKDGVLVNGGLELPAHSDTLEAVS
jgi:glutamate synthase domain-containing protein 3